MLIPAQYKTITKQVVKTPARTVERQIPAVTKQITRRVVDTEATVREIPIAASTETVTRRTVRQPARFMSYAEARDLNLLSRAQRLGTEGVGGATIRGFVDANSDGADDRDGLSRAGASAADRNGDNRSANAYGQRTGTYQSQVVAEPSRVVERVIPAVTKQVSRRVVKTPARAIERVVPAVTEAVSRRRCV